MDAIGEEIPLEETPTVSLHLRIPPHAKNEVREYAVYAECSLNTAALTLITKGLAASRNPNYKELA